MTQPWRPWSPSTSGGVVSRPVQTAGIGDGQPSMDVSLQLASSLLLTKLIRDRQEAEIQDDLKERGKLSINKSIFITPVLSTMKS